MDKEKILVLVSGGRTSGYMAWWMKEKMSHKYDITFMFANTGAEHEKTLEFVNKCDLFFGLNLIWVEAKVNPEISERTTYKIVDYETASRNGEPFEEVIKKYGIPNPDFKHCNRELKIRPRESLMIDLGINLRAIGIRSDEFSRATESIKKKNKDWNTSQILKYKYEEENVYYPLIEDEPVTKDAILHWWSKMPFDLEIKEHEGNCVTCWKKSDRKLWTLAKEDVTHFDFFNKMDEKYSDFIPESQKSRGGKQFFFRNYRSSKDIINEANTKSFEMFKEKSHYQLDLFSCNIDEDFSCSECGTI